MLWEWDSMIRRTVMGVLAGLAGSAAAAAAQTTVTVRVVSHDAKIIGTGVGGARVVIRDAATGAVLAEGEQQGGTGDTRLIMQDPRVRGTSPFDTPDAAHFVATVAIDTPTVVEIMAEAPLGFPHAMQRGSVTALLIPGQEVRGEGIVIELRGFIVELLEPASTASRGSTPVRARVRMLCGCPFTAGGLWDATRMTVVARVVDGARILAEAPLGFSGEPNIWAGEIAVPEAPPGARLQVLASDAERGNFGRSEARPVGR